MSSNYRNNYISIAKAIGIILMVIGHSGCPSIISRFIYLFHMPLFFVCSGYFFKEILDKNSLLYFYKRRINHLYFPYLKWSFLFLLLHNLFYYTYISPKSPYILDDYIKQLPIIIFMTDFELLLRPFWFIKALVISSILVASLSFLRNTIFTRLSNESMLFILLLFTLICKYLIINLPLLGDISIITLSSAYLYLGILFQEYENCIPLRISTAAIMFTTIVLGNALFVGTIDMRYTTTYSIIPYFILSIFGILTTYYISQRLEFISYLNKCLHYIGNHTMPIFVLNLLSLKIGSLFKVWIYKMPTEAISSYPIIFDHNDCFWIIYTIIGVTIPLLIEASYLHMIKKIKNYF